MYVFYFFAALVVLQGIFSLRGGFRFLSYVRGEMRRADDETYQPFVSLIVPCRGLDQNLMMNLRALFNQDYRTYELVFVVDNGNDAAVEVIRKAINEARDECGSRAPASRIVVAGSADGCGQKVHNLLRAIDEVDARCEVFTFVDSDARPSASWLRALVAPLKDESIGATTGYRWFVPTRGNFASHLRSVWNASIASALGANTNSNFCWGGATAMRRATFEAVNIRAAWHGALSDDFAITRTLRREGLTIRFVPQCLTPCFEDCSFTELLEFTTRQMKITRVYAPHLWRAVLISGLLFVAVFYSALALSIAQLAEGVRLPVPLILVVVMFALGAGKAYLRLLALRAAWRHDGKLEVVPCRPSTIVAHTVLWTLSSILYVYNAVAALVSRRIVWRGIVYNLASPHETIIIKD